jgi:hypothetical protein
MKGLYACIQVVVGVLSTGLVGACLSYYLVDAPKAARI